MPPAAASAAVSPAAAKPAGDAGAPLTLVQRLQAVAWRPPPASVPPPAPAALDSPTFPFQVACCELCGALCSPLSLYYRDTGTILYRVQQHCRKLAPGVLAAQQSALTTARSAQRGVLDVVDSLSIIETLNGPVERSLADVAHVAARAATLAQQAHAELQAQAARRDRKRQKEMDASNSLPTTPVQEDGEQEPALVDEGPLTSDSMGLLHLSADSDAASPVNILSPLPMQRRGSGRFNTTTPRDSLTRSSAATLPSSHLRSSSSTAAATSSVTHARYATAHAALNPMHSTTATLTPTSARLAAHSGPLLAMDLTPSNSRRGSGRNNFISATISEADHASEVAQVLSRDPLHDDDDTDLLDAAGSSDHHASAFIP